MPLELTVPPHVLTQRDLTSGSAKVITPLMGWMPEGNEFALPAQMPSSNTIILLGDVVAGVAPGWKALMVLTGIVV